MAFTDSTLTKHHMAAPSAAPSIWTYKTADAHATVDTSGYFTGGKTGSMTTGDIIFVVVVDDITLTDAAAVSTYGTHIVVSKSAAGVIDVSNVTVGVVTDTD